jgi:hypothetical protein
MSVAPARPPESTQSWIPRSPVLPWSPNSAWLLQESQKSHPLVWFPLQPPAEVQRARSAAPHAPPFGSWLGPWRFPGRFLRRTKGHV